MVTIATDALCVSLAGKRVIDDISLAFQPGALIGIVGPNGAGKSTLARTLLGLLAPDSGSVTVDGQAVTSLSGSALAKRIAYLPQTYSVHWPLSVERLVGLGRLPHLGPFSRVSVTDRAAIEAAMAETDTRYLADRTVTELSGGERARVMLARALATGAAGLIADEPLASLDPGHQIEMLTLLRSRARAGALVVVVLHDLGMAARFCERLILIDRGRISADGAPGAILTDKTLADTYGISVWRGEVHGEPLLVPLDRIGNRQDG